MVDSRRDGGPVESESADPLVARNRSERAATEDAPTQKITVALTQDARPATLSRDTLGISPDAAASGAAGPDASGVRKAAPLGDIMTRAEVAVLLRCSEPHVVALVEREALPGFRLGRPWRFRRSEVLAWCERRARGRRSA